jgi:hypothetical protein
MRFTAVLLTLLAAGVLPAAAQLSVETKEGWTFTFAGNVNAFYVFEREARGGQMTAPGALVGIGRQGSAVRSGYLPAFAVLGARRTEGPTTVGVHFGFAPHIQTTGGHEDSAGLGGRIDMRQVYLSAEGAWGQVLAGREIGIFARQNLLGDMSLFGTGATGGNFGNPGRATVGRSGFGYIYPGFNAQLTYSSPAGRPLQLTAGIFDPSANNGFDELLLPRFEGEVTWSAGGALLWTGGLIQHQTDTSLDRSVTAWGATAGLRIRSGAFAVLASGYTGRGIGTTRLFRDGRTAEPSSSRLRSSIGYLGQLTWSRTGQPLTLGASFGESRLEGADSEAPFQTRNRSASAGVVVQITPSLRSVGEITQAWSADTDPATRANGSTTASAGLMLFF